MGFSDPARDELRILRPQVDDEDGTRIRGHLVTLTGFRSAPAVRQTSRMEPETGIECPACGSSNPDGFRFCGTCGVALERTCSSCGTASPATFRFCGSCGAATAPEVAPDLDPADRDEEAGNERKVVTVLFADLAASTELATRLDPEDLHRVYSAYFDAMSFVVEGHGGIVEKFIGDAVVGVFGAPVTHGDDPQRAVRAGLAMHRSLDELNRGLVPDLGEELVLRVGVHTGEVIASPGSADQALVTGETTSIAARLQSIAPLGGVVVSGRTHQDAAGSFSFEDLGGVALKGVAEPIAAWSVTGETTGRASDGDHPLVGRADEVALLDVLLRRCQRDGNPHLALITGSAGVGKTRLAFEFTAAAGARSVRGRCLPYDGGLRLWPLAEVVKNEASILDSDPPDVIAAKAQVAIGPLFDATAPGGASLATLLSSIGIPVDPDPLAGAGPDVGRRMIVNTWAWYFTTLAADLPLIVWIEDLHWADDALLELLDGLLSRVGGPVLFLCLSRPELLERRSTWGAGGAASIFELSPLSRPESTSFVRELLEGDVDPAVTATIVDRAAGNPFFATELVRALVEDGSIDRRDGVWRASGEIALAMPDTVQTAIAARIDRLQPGEKRVLQTASVVGRTFWVGTWNELSGPDVESSIETLMDRGLVRRRPTSSVAGATECTFEHALIRDVAYGSITRSRRASTHRAVADWMERGTRGRDEEFAELIAHHAELAGDLERTARYATLAGHRHRRVYAAEEAIRWYERALLATEESDADHASSLRAEILHSRGEAREQLGDDDEALRDFERAAEIGRATGRPWLEAQELSAIASVLRSLERRDEAEAIIPQALDSARRAGLEYLEARVMGLAGELAWDRGDPVQARAQHDEALKISQEARDLEGEAFARTGLTEIGLCQGPLEAAIADGTRARQLWRRLGHRPTANVVAQMLGFLRLVAGDRSAAEGLFLEALEGARELGIGREESTPLTGLAWLSLQRGDLGGAASHLDDAITLATRSGATRAVIAARLARCLLWQEIGAPDLARADLDALDETVRRSVSYLRPVRLAARGWLEVAEGGGGAARATFSRARSEADGLLVPRIACGRFEIFAWYQVGEPEAVAQAATWLLGGSGGSLPSISALGAWASAWADPAGALDGCRRALELTRNDDDVTVRWRALALAAIRERERGDRGGGEALLAEARSLVQRLADSMDDELRHRFLVTPDVTALIGEDAPPTLS